MGGLIKYCEEEDNYAINDKFMKLFQSNEYYYSFDWDLDIVVCVSKNIGD